MSASETPTQDPAAPCMRTAALSLIFGWAVLLALRLGGPSDLLDNDQERPIAYALDAACNGNWLVPRDQTGDVASKPPLPTALRALCVLAAGGARRWALALPSALAVLASALMVLHVGWRRLGPTAGIVAGWSLLASIAAVKQLALLRTDPVFALLVPAAGFALLRAWEGRGSFATAGVLGAAACLTKGPLGVVLAGAGLLGILRSAPVTSRRGRGLGLSLLVALGLPASWLALATGIDGPAVLEKMIGRELVGHAVSGDQGGLFSGLHRPPFYFLVRYLPWSLPALAGLVLTLRDRPTAPLTRYCASALLVGLLIFGAAPHQRPDHLFPLLPFAALLAGRALLGLRFLSVLTTRPLACTALLVLAASIGTWIKFHDMMSAKPYAAEALAYARLADHLREHLTTDTTVLPWRTRYLVQAELDRMEPALPDDLTQAALPTPDRPCVLLAASPLPSDTSHHLEANGFSLHATAHEAGRIHAEAWVTPAFTAAPARRIVPHLSPTAALLLAALAATTALLLHRHFPPASPRRATSPVAAPTPRR